MRIVFAGVISFVRFFHCVLNYFRSVSLQSVSIYFTKRDVECV